jgi:hypothetical protein
MINKLVFLVSSSITCLSIILLDIVILIDTIGFESQFIKYDDSDSEGDNMIIYYVMYVEARFYD